MKTINNFFILIIVIIFSLFIMGAQCNTEDIGTPTTTTTTTTTIKGKINVVTDGPVYASCYDESNKILYIGGSFTQIGPRSGCGVPLNTSDGKPSIPLPDLPKVEGYVYAVVPDGSGGWYIGGSFTKVGSEPRNNIAHIDSSGNPTSWDPSADNTVYALAISGGAIYAGGSFTSIGGQTRNYIAAIDITTGNATSWNPSSNNAVTAFAISGDGSTIYAGGLFTSIGGQIRGYIAAIDASTGEILADY